MNNELKEIAEGLTSPQKRVIGHLTTDPTRATRGGAWSPVAAFNLVRAGLVELHQAFTGDRYSLTERGLAVRDYLRKQEGGR